VEKEASGRRIGLKADRLVTGRGGGTIKTTILAAARERRRAWLDTLTKGDSGVLEGAEPASGDGGDNQQWIRHVPTAQQTSPGFQR